MVSNELTTVSLKKTTIKLLKALKVHPRQSYDEIIKDLAGEKQHGKSAKKQPD